MHRSEGHEGGVPSGGRPEGEPLVVLGGAADHGGWRRLVLVPVGGWDRRTVNSVRHACRIPGAECRAVHVATDPGAVWPLGEAWMASDLGVTLDIVEDVALLTVAVL
jgi:hypothetical protein